MGKKDATQPTKSVNNDSLKIQVKSKKSLTFQNKGSLSQLYGGALGKKSTGVAEHDPNNSGSCNNQPGGTPPIRPAEVPSNSISRTPGASNYNLIIGEVSNQQAQKSQKHLLRKKLSRRETEKFKPTDYDDKLLKRLMSKALPQKEHYKINIIPCNNQKGSQHGTGDLGTMPKSKSYQHSNDPKQRQEGENIVIPKIPTSNSRTDIVVVQSKEDHDVKNVLPAFVERGSKRTRCKRFALQQQLPSIT